jgi:adenylate kinase
MALASGPKLVIFGRQGSGKGTQGAFLASHYGLLHLSTGAVLRQAVRAGTPLGRAVGVLLHEGRLVPDELMTMVVAAELDRPEVRRHGFLLDGFPRTAGQTTALLELVDGGLDAALYLDVPQRVVRTRLLARRVCPDCDTAVSAPDDEETLDCPMCGGCASRRDDDTPEAIDRRLTTFARTAAPVLQAFRDRGLLVTVDSVGTPDEVFERVLAGLRPTIWGTGEAVG